MSNFITQWIDDEGDVRECAWLPIERADKLARETDGWVIGFDPRGKQITVVSYYQQAS